LQWLVFGITFGTSFVVYAMLRQLDVWSTKEFSKYLDMQRHEVNPIVTKLLRHGWTLDQTFNFLLFAQALPIAFLDASLNTYVLFGAPLLAFFVGSFHLVAALHNSAQIPTLKKQTKEQIRQKEEENIELAHRFWAAPLRGKLRIFWEKNPFELSMSIVFIMAWALLYYASNSVGLLNVMLLFYGHGYPTYSFFTIGVVLSTVSLAFYPLSTMATFVMLHRYGGFPLPSPNVMKVDPPGDGEWSEFTVEQLKGAIRIAEENNTDTVRLWVSKSEGQEDVGNANMSREEVK
jgi:hypothetical protein